MPQRPTVLVASGHHEESLALLRERWDVVDRVVQREALDWLRAAPELPHAVAVGYYHRPGHDLGAREMLSEILALDADLPVVVSTRTASPAAIVDLVKRGAFDYVHEPTEADPPERWERFHQDLLLSLDRAVRWRSMLLENRRLRDDLGRGGGAVPLVTRSPAMLRALDLAAKAAPTPAPVLIVGESGTGKELVARAIHERSPRADEPFVAVNCGALSPQLLASELLGHVRGAFTGADRDRAGLIREAGAGTLFLDELASIPQDFQVLLLRVLEQKSARPVGGAAEYRLRCRFIAATNRDPRALVSEGRFRDDLFYRLNTVTVQLPPLRERRGDVSVLAQHFLDRAAREFARDCGGIDAAAMELLEAYPWPGNVRQLRNAIERAVIVADGDRIGIQDLDPDLRGSVAPLDPHGGLEEALRAVEARMIKAALDRHGGNLSAAARELRIKRTTLHYRLGQLGIGR